VNLAARLMEYAEAGQVLASARTREAGGQTFVWEPVLPITLKGKAHPVSVFRLTGRRTTEGLHLVEPVHELPMVGRRAELDRLTALLARARANEGQVVEVLGDAGMGKSRLVGELVRHARARGFHVLGGQAQSFGAQTSYLGWGGVWRGYFLLPESGTNEELAATLGAQLLAMNPALLPRLPLLGAALNLTIPDNDTTRSLDAKLRKAALEGLLVECIRHRAGRGPLLIVLEDAHWLDPLSRDLAETIARGLQFLPVVLLLALRPPDAGRETEGGWRALPHFSELRLGELPPADAEELIRGKLRQLGGGDATPDPVVVQRLLERAQGNPFYLEETLNLLRDEGRDPNDPASWEDLQLPDSLQSLILSRMDRLSERQKPTLKIASIIGRVFEPGTISAIYPELHEPDVREHLSELERLELTAKERPEPELAFIFRHVVTQEVAYETLPYSTRARLHGQLGLFLERRNAAALDRHLDLLAFHFDRSDLEDKRRHYLLRAGYAAQDRYANAAAINYFRRVLPLLPPTERIPALLSLASVLEVTGDWSAAADTYAGALGLAQELGDRAAEARCLAAFGQLRRKQGDFAEANRQIGEARVLFQEVGDEAGIAQALNAAGSLAAQQGAYARARDLYFEGLEIRRRLEDHAGVGSLLSNLGIIAWFQGDFIDARRLHEEALALRRRLGNRWAIGNSLNNLALVVRDLGDAAQACRLLEECVAINRELGDRWSIANALGSLADVAISQGDAASAREFLAENIRINRELGDRTGLAFSLELSAQVAGVQGRPGVALRLAAAAGGLRESIGAPLSPSEQDRLDQTLAAACSTLNPAEQAEARQQGLALGLEAAIQLALAEDSAAA
jgi:predicted ATPase